MIFKHNEACKSEWKSNILFGFMICFAHLCVAGNLSNSLLFYENCDDLKSTYPGVRISKSIRIENNGKFGKCLRIERRTVNALENGNFANASSDSFIFRGNVTWMEKGGRANSSCLKINGGKIFIPITGLKPDNANAFSFFAKNADASTNAELSVSWKTQGKTTILLKNFKPRVEMSRIKVVLTTPTDSGTVAITVKGAVIIDDAMLDKGLGFFNSYAKPLKKRNVDRIEIPANGKYFHPEKGAVSCWINAPWLNAMACSDVYCGIFTVRNAPARIKKWGDSTILNMNCSPKRTTNGKCGTLYAYIIDAKTRNASLAKPLNKLKQVPAKTWRHLVFNWNVKDKQATLSLYVDGEKMLSTIKPFDSAKKPLLINIGNSGGS
jgi:hypothetical protein